MKKFIALASLMLTVSCAQATEYKDIQIKRADGTTVTFHVERATDDKTRADGLMYRESLIEDGGMLFLYDEPMRLAFWMKNTLIPLDMLFIKSDGEIVFIEPSAKPKTLASRGPDRADICAVLELAGGKAAEKGIKPGDRLILDDASACLP